MLSPLDPPKRHRDLQAKRYKGSVLWLLEQQRFRMWQDSSIRTENTSHRIVQCYGIPGAGKTIIRLAWGHSNTSVHVGLTLWQLHGDRSSFGSLW